MAELNEVQIGSKVEGNADTNGNGGTPGNRPTPVERLAELQAEIADQNTQLAELTEDNKLKKSDEAILRKLVTDLDKVVDEYGKGTASYRSQLDHFKTYADNKGQMIAAAIKDKAQEIHAVRSGCQLQIDTLKRELAQAEQKLNTTKNEYEKARAAFQLMTGIFDRFKISKKTVEDNLKGMAALKTDIEAKECENKFGVMYFLFLELHQLRANTESNVVDKDSFRSNLYNYWADMSDAQTEFRAKEALWLDAKAAHENKQKELQTAEAGFRNKVIEELGKIQF